MSDISKSLRSYLLQASQLTSLIGQRMYPDALPQKATIPAVVYSKFATRNVHDIGDITGLASAVFEITCYGANRGAADQVAKAFRQSGIFSYRGTIDGIEFCGARMTSGASSADEPPTDGSQVHRYLTSFDIEVDFKETL